MKPVLQQWQLQPEGPEESPSSLLPQGEIEFPWNNLALQTDASGRCRTCQGHPAGCGRERVPDRRQGWPQLSFCPHRPVALTQPWGDVPLVNVLPGPSALRANLGDAFHDTRRQAHPKHLLGDRGERARRRIQAFPRHSPCPGPMPPASNLLIGENTCDVF